MAKTNQHGLRRTYRIKGILFLLPAVLLYLFYAVIPVIDNFILSFHSWDAWNDRVFIGIDNYIKAFQDTDFLTAIKNSVYIGGVSAVFSVIIGVLLAWLLLYTNRKAGGLYRTILFSPSMIPPVITALVFSFVYADSGILNNILGIFNIGKIAWLGSKDFIINSITFVSLWKQIGLTVVLCFAGMQAISPSLIESAYLEGATDFNIFRKIILPLIMPFVQLSAVFALMSGLKIYDTVLALTAGGPGRFSLVIPMWIYSNAFDFGQFGYGATMSVIFVFIVLIAVVISRKLIKGTSYEL